MAITLGIYINDSSVGEGIWLLPRELMVQSLLIVTSISSALAAAPYSLPLAQEFIRRSIIYVIKLQTKLFT